MSEPNTRGLGFVAEISSPTAVVDGLACPECGPQPFVTFVTTHMDRGTSEMGWVCARCGGKEYMNTQPKERER